MSDSDTIDLLEKYILSENKQQFFDSLVENSDSFFYMKLMDELNQHGLNIPEDIKQKLNNYTELRDNEKSRKILLKWLILQIEDPNIDQAKRASLLQVLNDKTFKFKFEYQRPKQIKGLDNFQTEMELTQVTSKLPEGFERLFDYNFYFELLYENKDAQQMFEKLAQYLSDENKALLRDKKRFDETIKALLTNMSAPLKRKLDMSRVPQRQWKDVFTNMSTNPAPIDNTEEFNNNLLKLIQ